MYGPSEAARRRMHVIAHGGYVGHYATDLDQAESRAQLGLPSTGTVFAFVGAIRGYKNVAEMLDAFATLPEAGPDERLIIAGKPLPRRLGRELEERAAGDQRIVLRLDRQTEEELSTILRAADVAVTPFREILTSGSAILALSHGRPIVAPAMGCLPQTLPGDASFLYDPDAEDGLTGAMRWALSADLRVMGAHAFDYAESLDWGPIAAETSELYGAR
jgi:glycosyltransferase involved in cell wall biosynthesis